jgi:hypothetical protein
VLGSGGFLQNKKHLEEVTGVGTTLDKRGSQASTEKPTTKHCGGFQQAWEKKRQKLLEP